MFSFLRKPEPAPEATATPAVDLAGVLDSLPINVICCDPNTASITYLNKTAVETLKSIKHLLPGHVNPDVMVGVSIDVFHKSPHLQRAIVQDHARLPHRAKIKLGPETLDLNVRPMRDATGRYVGAVLSWSVVTGLADAIANFEQKMTSAMSQVGAAAETMRVTSHGMAATADQTSSRATESAAGTEEATTNVQTVASATTQLSASIAEISRQVTHASGIARAAVDTARRTTETVRELSGSSEKIGHVVGLIQDIAAQTNLLALNATIEAARAGEAGRGFAVVAAEVKNLAGQTTKATEDITAQIAAIQVTTRSTVSAIGEISGTIDRMNEASAAISAAVEEQSVTTDEIGRNITEAASGTRVVAQAMSQVQAAAEDTRAAARGVLEAADQVVRQAGEMGQEVTAFLSTVRKV